MDKKKILIGGLVIVGALAYFYFDKKKKEKEALLSGTTGTGYDTAVLVKNNYAVSLKDDTQGSVWIVIDGKKYEVGGTQALIDYGFDPAKYPYEVLSKSELDAIPTGGYITEKRVIVRL